ncbi:DNA oxidative demethylase ALKBH2 [Blattella germanica]|nr:DNA oxidative demethylase ALKBH2 [Blattella germanica]
MEEGRSLEEQLDDFKAEKLVWAKTAAVCLDVDYTILLPRTLASQLFQRLESELEYYSGDLAKIFVYGKYRDGNDHISEHRDDEKDLDPNMPIASLSLGQTRDFVFRHRDARKPAPYKKNIPPVNLVLEHGSLLMMNPPTNKLWFHSLPKRKRCPGVRLNLTFRSIFPKESKHHVTG